LQSAIAREMMDELECRRKNDKNLLVLKTKIRESSRKEITQREHPDG